MRTVLLGLMVVTLLSSAGCGVASRLTASLRGETPAKAARQMEDPYFPDERRQGILKLAKYDFGKREPYTTRYKQIAEGDSDFTVRAAAIRALNISRDASATGIFIKALDDKSELVRLEAAKALVNVPDEAAKPVLLRTLQNAAESKDVRIAAAGALKHYHTVDVARTLASTLGVRDFGLAWQSRRSLVVLTGHDLRYDETAWLSFITGPEKPFG